MEVVIVPEPQDVARLAADVVERLVRHRPDAVLGVATGSSPLGLYAQLRSRVGAGRLSLARCHAFMLDEYVGLPAGHPQRYRSVIEHELADGTDLPVAHVHGPDGAADDVPAACAAYEREIAAAGGIDLQVLGLGSDGHVAFNEPGSSLGSRTRIKTLTRRTRSDNARFFGDDPDAVPGHCLTQGVATILEARHLLLLVTGERKAAALAATVEGPLTAMCPGSALQLHPHVTVLSDEPAAAQLTRRDYYVETYAAKPAWQHL